MLFKKLSILFLCLPYIVFASDAYKEKKIYPMGEKIFKARCSQDIDLKGYNNIGELKKDIKENALCKPLKDKHLEILSIYLWDIKRVDAKDGDELHIDVPHDAKCPVCGMFVYKYPRWAAKIDKLYFDGAKDMMKFYFDSDKNFHTILVTDYYKQKAIDAKNAYYVIGSDVYGPMGDELIPFEDENSAKTFNLDHNGKKILKFEQITEGEVYKLDE